MRWVRVILLALVATILQLGLLSPLRIGAALPNLALVTVVFATVWLTASQSLLLAVIVGIVLDMASGSGFGLATSSLVLICLAGLAVRQSGVDGSQLVLRLTLVAAASLLWALIHILAVGAVQLLLATSWRVILIEVGINCLMAVYGGRRVFGGRTI